MRKLFLFAWLLLLATMTSFAIANDVELTADELFTQAISAQRAGDSATHDRLLAEALRQDPQHKLARWHRGQILFDGKWQLVEEVTRRLATDPLRTEYRDRVESLSDCLDSHVELARWCKSQGLELEEKWHWVNVLRFAGDHREALGRLGMRRVKGELVAVDEIAAREAAAEELRQDFKRYTKLLKSAIQLAQRTHGAERADALKKISSIKNPAAIAAIYTAVLNNPQNESRILDKLGRERGEQLFRDLQLAAIAALSEMPEHDATLCLLETALWNSDEAIRTSAATALKYRELTDFVPMLMAALAEPIELSVGVNALPNGQLNVVTEYFESGPLAERRHTSSSDYLTQYIRIDARNNPNNRSRIPGGSRVARIEGVWTNHLRDRQNAMAEITNSRDQVAAENALRESRNARISQVLAIVFQKDEGNPRTWWKAWKDYNELYTPENLPRYETAEAADYTAQYVEVRTMSCFVAGTPVWTNRGPVAIETIQIGDLVLSQNPHTGELNFRPVVDTTIRPPSGTIKLGINQEEIVTTRGHRFWVTLDGWRMAKHLKAGEQVVTTSGAVDLRSVSEGSEETAYNLEVGQFHTYFVGKNHVLVHDNTCPQPTTNILPGVGSNAKSSARLASRN
jgi:hypothetical protein